MPEPDSPSRQTLDEVPNRVFTFVMAVAVNPAIAAALATRGYNDQEHEYAWTRVSKLVALPPAAAGTPDIDRAVREAMAELDAWDEPHFACIKAVLKRRHRAQHDFVFKNLEPRQGDEAVLSVSTLLDRLDALESAPERQATRQADEAALATLAARGYTKAERERLRALVNLAQGLVIPAAPSTAERERIVHELYDWLIDWSTTARTVITRRDYLIRLGLAKRRKRAKASGIGVVARGSTGAAGGGTGAPTGETAGASAVVPAIGASGGGDPPR